MYLNHRWKTLWLKIPHRGEVPGLHNLESDYNRPFRAYHDLPFHVLHCLRELDSVIHLCQNPEAAELALWLHDVHHTTCGKDNEEQSVTYTLYLLEKLNVDGRFQEVVREHILATKHAGVPKRPDSRLVADIDLSIMGYPVHIWREVKIRIALEYQHVPIQIFQTRRAEILQGFLERDHIYHTDFFRDKYEVQARKNLKEAVESIAEFTYARFCEQYSKLDDFLSMDELLSRW